MFQDKLSTLIIRCIESDKFRQTNEFLDLDDFVVKKARTGRGHRECIPPSRPKEVVT